MKRVLFTVIASLVFASIGMAAYSTELNDWRGMHRVHEHIQQVVHELEKLRIAQDDEGADQDLREKRLSDRDAQAPHESVATTREMP